MKIMQPTDNGKPAGLVRRLAALFYDTLLVIALLMIGAGIVIAALDALHAASLIHFNAYQDAADLVNHHPIGSWLYRGYLLLLWSGFFIIFWRKGQTLGMRAWQIRVQNQDLSPISTKQAMIRFITSFFGIGHFLTCFTNPKRSLQDICSHSEVVLYPIQKL